MLAEFSIYLYIISRVPHRAHIRPQPAIILLLDINSKDVILWSIILLVLIIPCFVKMSPQMIFYHIKYLHLKDNLLILIYFQFFSTLLFSVLLLSNHHFLDCFGALLLVGNRTVKCSIHELKVKVYLKQVGSSTDLVENRGQNGLHLRLLYLDKRIEFVEFKKLPISNLDFVGGQRGWQIWQQKQLRHCVSFLVLKMFYTRYEI